MAILKVMKLYSITETKKLTDALFISDVFDNFLITEAEFVTAVTVSLNGMLSSHAEGADEFASWKSVKPLAVSAVRGDALPRSFKIILRLSNSNAASTGACIGADPKLGANYYINIRFDGKGISLISGISFAAFALDKGIGAAWDNLVGRFLTANKIDFSCPES